MSRIAARALMAAVALGTVASPAGPAAATEFILIEEPWQEVVRCGDAEGVASGTVVQRIRLHEQRDGTVAFQLTERVKDSTFVTTDGETYRVMGAGTARGQEEPEFVLDQQVLHLTFVGPAGRLGSLHERYDGTTRHVSGGCSFA